MPQDDVVRVRELDVAALQSLLERYQLRVQLVGDEDDIPGSFWGNSEAGLINNTLYVRPDTPAHSLLHEACHYICMSEQRRASLHTDAGGGYDEENGVCYLQIILASYLPPLNSARMMVDMDKWGYSFRLGSAARWFSEDAQDARDWLQSHELIDISTKPTWQLRR